MKLSWTLILRLGFVAVVVGTALGALPYWVVAALVALFVADIAVAFLVARWTARCVARGEFESFLDDWADIVEKQPDSPESEFLRVQLGELHMRRGEFAEAVKRFREVVDGNRTGALVEYSKLNIAACDALQNRETQVTLGDVPPGAELGYCIVAASRGDRDRALAVTYHVARWPRFWHGNQRFAHDGRMLAVLQAAIRGDWRDLPDERRVALRARYPGEYDYLANELPQVREVVDGLRLYGPGDRIGRL